MFAAHTDEYKAALNEFTNFATEKLTKTPIFKLSLNVFDKMFSAAFVTRPLHVELHT